MNHIPVLLTETMALLNPQPNEYFADGTLGGGGHAAAILERVGPSARFIGTDRDADAVARFTERFAKKFPRAAARAASYASLPDLVDGKLDGLLLDLGFSSYQIDDPSRGLSFTHTGPLDMRYDRSGGPTAADLVNSLSEAKLADAIYRYGEERSARKIAAAIVAARRKRKFTKTDDLVRTIDLVIGGRGKIHPATRTFQALRILVNGELVELEKILVALPRLMARGGRVAIISFHSLEDRLVKDAFRRLAADGQAEILTKKPVTPSRGEVAANPRSRSAKLRAIRFL